MGVSLIPNTTKVNNLRRIHVLCSMSQYKSPDRLLAINIINERSVEMLKPLAFPVPKFEWNLNISRFLEITPASIHSSVWKYKNKQTKEFPGRNNRWQWTKRTQLLKQNPIKVKRDSSWFLRNSSLLTLFCKSQEKFPWKTYSLYIMLLEIVYYFYPSEHDKQCDSYKWVLSYHGNL